MRRAKSTPAPYCAQMLGHTQGWNWARAGMPKSRMARIVTVRMRVSIFMPTSYIFLQKVYMISVNLSI